MRLIDVEAKALTERINRNFGAVTRYIVKAILKDAPTIDAVPVVRCKDCTHWGGVVFGNVCRRWSAPLAGMKNCTGPDDFCSYGERKDGEG